MSSSDLEDLLNEPALAPPDGITPNFENPPSGNTTAYAALTACLAVTTISVVIRAYSKILGTKKPRLEDGLGLVAYGLYVGFAYCCYALIDSPGFFVHQWDVRVRDMSRVLYLFYLGTNFYGDTIWALKMAIILEWLRIFNPRNTRNVFWWTCQIVLWLNILYYVASVFAVNLACIPHAKIWDKSIQEGTCINSIAVFFSGTIVNFVSDIAILLIPQRVIWKLKLSPKKRIGLSFIFAIGVLCCVIAAFRIASVTTMFTEQDVTYIIAPSGLWGVGENTLVFLVFCVPAFPQAFSTMGMRRSVPSGSGLADPQHKGSLGRSGNGPHEALGGLPNPYRKIDEFELKELSRHDTAVNLPVQGVEEQRWGIHTGNSGGTGAVRFPRHDSAV